MFNPNELQTYILSRRDALIDEGKYSRFMNDAAVSQRSPFYAPTFARMGMLLLGIGSKLLSQYGDTHVDVTLTPCADCQITGNA